MLEHVYLIPLIPLLSSLVILLGFKEDPHSKAPFIGLAAMLWCFIQSVAIFAGVAGGSITLPYQANIPWFKVASDAGGAPFVYEMPVGVLIDGPAATMLVVVTLVSFLVQLYSLSYMHGDARFKRYYAYLSFFTASMLGLVVSSNLLVTFMCWELVGVSSYLLIGFWFEKPGPAYASKKAFITTKLGDCGLYLGLAAVFAKFGTFQITQMQDFVARGYLPEIWAAAIGLGFLFAAAGKSAQFPLFIWLPDAMEGPTPVSALIHAATMVAAGIYLVAKTYFIYAASPLAMEFVAWTGLITAFMAATMALVAYDIKRVLAFSTVSQLGFMMCALGVGGYTAGIFHLTTHAFFKALLFLGAGSVIHAVHTNDMRQMGGLSKKMPVTFLTMLVATLAIAGFPFLSGWYSKEMILAKVYEHSLPMFLLLSFSALMTAFYMFRLIFLTFTGTDRDHEKHHHAHESPLVMTFPLMLLGVLSVVAGFALEHTHLIQKLTELPFKLPEPHGHHMPHAVGYGVTAAAMGAIGLSWVFYRGPTYPIADAIKAKTGLVFKALENRYGFDIFFLWLVKLSDGVARAAFWFDSQVIDRVFVDGWALVTNTFSELSRFFDTIFVDRTVDGFGGLSYDVGAGLRSLVADGQVQQYLMYVAVAVSLFTMFVLSH